MTQLETDKGIFRLLEWVMMHDLESGVEWFVCVYAHGAYFSDSIKPRCDKSSLLLWPSNIHIRRIVGMAQVPKNRRRFRDLRRRERAGTDLLLFYRHLWSQQMVRTKVFLSFFKINLGPVSTNHIPPCSTLTYDHIATSHSGHTPKH